MFSSIHIEYEWDQVNKQTKTHCVHFFIRPFIASFLTCLSPRHTTPPLPSSAAQFYSLLRWKHWSSSLELLSTLIHRRYKTADTEVSSQHTVGSGEALSLFDLSFYFFLQMEVIFVQFMMIIQLAAEKTTPKANKTTWMKTRLPSSDTHRDAHTYSTCICTHAVSSRCDASEETFQQMPTMCHVDGWGCSDRKARGKGNIAATLDTSHSRSETGQDGTKAGSRKRGWSQRGRAEGI